MFQAFLTLLFKRGHLVSFLSAVGLQKQLEESVLDLASLSICMLGRWLHIVQPFPLQLVLGIRGGEPKKFMASHGTSILIESTYSMCPINVPGNWPVARASGTTALLVTLKVYGNTSLGQPGLRSTRCFRKLFWKEKTHIWTQSLCLKNW